MNNMFKSFQEFSDFLENIANDLHTMIEVKSYDDYNFGNISLMTDKFGGVYCNFHYDFKTGLIHDWYGTENNVLFTSVDEFLPYIKEKLEYILKNRDFESLSDFINSQY